MYGIVSFIPFKDLAFNLINAGAEIHHQNFNDQELKELNISRESIKLENRNAPKRLKTLDSDVYIVNAKNDKFIIVIGLQNGVPYEIFGGHANGFNIKENAQGKLTKISKGKYSLQIDDKIINDLSTQFTPVEQILFRMVSTMLRHGIPINFIIEQLYKATEDITSLAASACRVLKKYIKDGQRVTGQECPNCKSTELSYSDGCVKCGQCEWTKCQ